MKVSVSLPGEDIRFLDDYAEVQGLGSRSAALHKAVRLLRAAELAVEYESAWDEWNGAQEAEAWESTARDGVAS